MLTEPDVRTFWEQGFVVLRGRFRDRAAVLHQALQDMLRAPEPVRCHYGRRFGPSGFASSHRFGGIMRTNPEFAGHACDPRILEAVEGILGPAEAFRDVVLSKPARSGGTLAAHQDLAYWDLGHDRVLTSWLAMTPARRDSGALWLIPGSHRRLLEHRTVLSDRPVPRFVTRLLRRLVSLTGTGDSPRDARQRRWARLKDLSLEEVTRRWPGLAGLGDLQILDEDLPGAEPMMLTAEPGDLVLFHGLTIHGSRANQLDTRRDAYLVTYAAKT